MPPTGGPRVCYNTCVAKSIGKAVGIIGLEGACADAVEESSARRSLKVFTKVLDKVLVVKNVYGMVGSDIPACYDKCALSTYGY